MLKMITEDDRKNLLNKGKRLAGTDEILMANLLGFQSGLNMGITIAMARQGMDKEDVEQM